MEFICKFFENLTHFINASVDGKRCYHCQMPHRTPADECGNFEIKKTRTCKEKGDGSCIKYSIRDTTYYSCEGIGNYALGSVSFNSPKKCKEGV